jgi:hypothetical protein
VIGDGLGVVARRHGHHAAAALLLVQQQQLVERAPLLEGGDELEVLELHHHRAPQDLGQRAGVGAGGAFHGPGDALGRVHYVVVGDR